MDEAARLCSHRMPDVAVVDLQLPGGNGWDFVRRVRSGGASSQMRIIIYTVHEPDPDARRAARGLDVTEYVTKDADPWTLAASVSRLFDSA